MKTVSCATCGTDYIGKDGYYIPMCICEVKPTTNKGGSYDSIDGDKRGEDSCGD